jgi:hypothetical protein
MVTIQPLAVGRAARAINGLARFTHAPEKARASGKALNSYLKCNDPAVIKTKRG